MEARSLAELLRVLQFGDSTLPVGGFAFSNGLESAIQTGVVRDVKTLGGFVTAVVQQSSRVEGVALLAAHRAASARNAEGIRAADAALWRRRVGVEQQAMTSRMGKKLAELGGRVLADPDGVLASWLAAIREGRTPGCFPIAHAVVFAVQDLPEGDAFAVHQYGVAQMILGAALRLMKVDHVETQRLLHVENGRCDEAYRLVRELPLDGMAGFSPVLDVLIAHHAGAHVRMFMT